MSNSANDMTPTDPSRVYFCNWVTISYLGKRLLNGQPCEVVHDTGHRVWILVYYDKINDLPHGARKIFDNGDTAIDVNGNYIVSFPVEWCMFIDDDMADAIIKCANADETHHEYTN